MSRALQVAFGTAATSAAVAAHGAAINAVAQKLGVTVTTTNAPSSVPSGSVVVGASAEELQQLAAASTVHSSITSPNASAALVRARFNSAANTSPLPLRDQPDAFSAAGISADEAVEQVKASFEKTLSQAIAQAKARGVNRIVIVTKTNISKNERILDIVTETAADVEKSATAQNAGVNSIVVVPTAQGHNQMVMFPESIVNQAVVVVPDVNGSTADVTENLFIGLNGGGNNVPTSHLNDDGEAFVSAAGASETNVAGTLLAVAHSLKEQKLADAVKKAVAANPKDANAFASAVVAGL